MAVKQRESLIEASVEWQGTVLDIRHFPASSGVPQEFNGYEGISEALGRLEPGGVERTSAGPLSLSVRYVSCGESVPRKPMEWAPLGYVGATMVLTGMFLALMALSPPRGQAMSVPDQTLAGRLVSFETQPLEWLETSQTETQEDLEEAHGMEWGRQGVAGSAEADVSPRRRQEQVSDAMNTRAAAERSGVLSLGAMFEGVGASDSPFERALGQDMDAALGNLTGLVSGESFGLGGLALMGTGRHAGGDGRGAIRRPDGLGGLSAGMNGACGCGAPSPGGGGFANGRIGFGVRGGEPLDETNEERVSAVPHIRSSGPEVRGSLDPALIRRVVRRHRNETRHCYEQALQSRPDLAGRVEARFVIDPGGAVVAATLASSTLSNSGVEECVLQVVRRMGFPATPGGNVSVVSYPWVFSTL